MAKDTRIFRVTRSGKIQYKSRVAVSAIFGTTMKSYYKTFPAKVEATNAEATAGWTDVTDEFINPVTPKVQCRYHKGYTGVRKPTYRDSHGRYCSCWAVYRDTHPDAPGHSDFCDRWNSDATLCECVSIKKIFG
jgi:hypothetical protein